MLRSTLTPTRLAILSGSIAGIILAMAPSTNAQLYFDINGATAGSGTPGTATWDTGTNWTTDSTGSSATSGWLNGSAAIFSAGTEAAGTWTINIGGTIQTNSITFNGGTNNTVHNINGGTIEAGSGLLTLDAAAAGVASGRSKTISSVITGTGGVTIAANGDTSNTGGGSNTIFTLSGANTFTGGVTITSGVVGYSSNFGDAANAITLNGGGIVGNTTGSLSRNLVIGTSGGVLRTYGSATLTLSGAISGSGAITRTDGGTAIFTGNLSGFSGAFNNNAATAIFETNNSLTGAVNVNAGAVIVGNNGATGSLAGASSISIADTTTLAVRRTDTVNASAVLPSTINFAAAGSSLEYSPNTASAVLNLDRDLGSTTDVGRLRITGGTLNLVSGTDVVVNAVSLGLQSSTNLGTLNIAAGSSLTTNYLGIGESASNSAVVNQTGGTVTILTAGNNFRVGHWDNGTNPGSSYNLSGGTLDTTATTSTISHDGTGTITIGGGAATATWKVGALNFDAGATDAKVGQVVVSTNGVIEANGAIGNSNDAAVGEGIVLNGGTIKAMAANSWNPLITANAATTSTIDANGFDVTLTNNVAGAGTINLTGAGSVILDTGTNTRTIAASLAGSAAITKNGNGIANLTGSGSYSGTMAANAGILAINGNYSSASVNVGAAGALGGKGTVSQITMTTSGGKLSVNGAAAGALTTTNVSFGAGVLVDVAVAPLTANTFTVLNYSGTLTGFANLAVQDAGNYRSAVLTNTGTSVTLNIGSKDLVWNGTSGGEWNIKNSTRWNAGEVDQFAWGDRVKFDETGTATAVTLTGELRPASIIVDSNAKNYSFTGSTGNLIGGSTNLLKSGPSTLTINAPNTYTGGTTISQGIVQVGNGASLGTGAVTLGDANTGSQNVALYLDTSRTTINNQVIVSNNGTGTATIGSRATVTGSGANNLFNNIVLQRDVTFDSNAADRTDYRTISGTGNITIAGAGRSVFPNANTFVGNLTVSTTGTGALQLGTNSTAFNAIPDSTNVTVSAGALLNLSYTANGTETINGLNGGGTIGNNGGAANTLIVGGANGSGDFSGIIRNGGAPTFGLTKNGTGTQTLSGTASTYTGVTTVSGGTLQAASLANGGVASSIGQSTNAAANLIINGGALTLAGSAPSSTDRLFQVGVGTAGQGGEIGNNSANAANTLTFANTGVVTYGTTNQTRTFTLSGSNTGDNTFAPVIGNNGTGAVTFNKTGAGKWILTGANAYTGATTISGGTLQVGNGGATGQLGTGSVSLAAGATLTFNRTGAATIAGALNSAAGDAGTLNVDGGVALTLGLGGNFSGTVNVLNGSLIFGATNPTGNATNPADFNLSPNTTLTNGTSTTHGHIGNVTLSGATWTTSAGTSNYDGENYQLDGDVTVTGNAPSTITRDAARTDANAGVSLNGQRTFNVNNVTGNAATDLKVMTQLEPRDAGVVGGFTKEGAGTMELAVGPVHNYAGPTTVNAGTLLVNATLNGSATTVNGGTLGGIGTLSATTIESGGTLSPGLSIGTLNFSSTLSLAGTVNTEVAKAGSTLSSDLVNVTGLLSLGGTLNVAASGDALVSGDTFNLFDAGSFAGNFAAVNLPALGGDLFWDTSALPSTGSITVVPEPSMATALFGGIGLLLGLRRHRRDR